MTCHATPCNRHQVHELNKAVASCSKDPHTGLLDSIESIRNTAAVARAIDKFTPNPAQKDKMHALINELCMQDLPSNVVNAGMSKNGQNVKSLLGLLASNIRDEEDKKTLDKVCGQLSKADSESKKEAEVEPDLHRLLSKYGEISLKRHVNQLLIICREAWKANHKITGSPDNIDENAIFSTDLVIVHGQIKAKIANIVNGGLDFDSIAQQFVFFQNACKALPHTLLNHDNQDPGPQERLPEPKRPKILDPQASAPASNGHGPINIHVEGSTANATINGNSSPTLTTPDLALIDLAKTLAVTEKEVPEAHRLLIRDIIDHIRNRDSHNRGAGGIIQNLQSVTPAEEIISHESVSVNQRLAQVVQQPDTFAAEKPFYHTDPEGLTVSAKRQQPLPVANDIAEIDFTEIDSAAAFSTAIVPKMLPGTQRQDQNRSAERNSTAPEPKGKTTQPEQSETPAKWVETTQSELVAYSVDNKVDLTSQVAESLSGLSNNISVAIKQPSDLQAYPRDGMGIHSGGNPNNSLYSDSKESRTAGRDIFADNHPVYGDPRAKFRKLVDFFEKKSNRDHSNKTPFETGNSISVSNSESGAKFFAERKPYQLNKTKNYLSSTIGNSPRIHTTNRSFDTYNQRSTPSKNHVRQFSSASTEIKKGNSHRSENDIGEITLDNLATQYE